MDLCWLRVKLVQWGRMCRADGGGYPSMSTTERARVGRGGSFDGPNLPDDLAEIDALVARSPPQHKLMLVEIYTKSGGPKDHAARLCLSVDSYYRRKKTAEVFLNSQLRSASESVGCRAS